MYVCTYIRLLHTLFIFNVATTVVVCTTVVKYSEKVNNGHLFDFFFSFLSLNTPVLSDSIVLA